LIWVPCWNCSVREAAALKAAAMEIINDAIAEGLDEIDKLHACMNWEFQTSIKV